jgi:MarR family transcriptional regulator, organic hydroperoxide resistance regulator
MFERCLYFNLNALTRSVNAIWNNAFSEFNLSPSHAYLLRLVLSNSGLTPKQISLELKLEKSTVTRFIDALVRKDFIRREKGSNQDAREQSIFATQKAKDIEENLEIKGNELYQQMIDKIDKEKLILLVKQLRNTRKNIK